MATKETVLEDMQKLIDLANETTGESRTSLKEGVNDLVNVAENKQDKLTAGEGITIDENNVISSAGGSLNKYFHSIAIAFGNSSQLAVDGGSLFIINDSETPFTYDTLRDYLYQKGYQSVAHSYFCCGHKTFTNGEAMIFGIYAAASGLDYIYNLNNRWNSNSFAKGSVSFLDSVNEL